MLNPGCQSVKRWFTNIRFDWLLAWLINNSVVHTWRTSFVERSPRKWASWLDDFDGDTRRNFFAATGFSSSWQTTNVHSSSTEPVHCVNDQFVNEACLVHRKKLKLQQLNCGNRESSNDTLQPRLQFNLFNISAVRIVFFHFESKPIIIVSLKSLQ